MARITQYTRETMPNQLIRARANPEAFGADRSGEIAMSQAMSGIGQAIQERQEAVRKRNDVINKTRALSSFEQQASTGLMQFETEADLTDPNATSSYRASLDAQAKQILDGFNGSEDARATLEAQMSAMIGDYSIRATSMATEAQNAYILQSVESRISPISATVNRDPSALGDAFKEVEAIIQEFAPAMRVQDELNVTQSAHQQLVLSAVNAMTGSGNYEGARDLINENPDFMNVLNPVQQRTLVTTIDNGIRTQLEQRNKVRNQMSAIKNTAREFGVDVSDAQIFSSVTGIKPSDDPNVAVESFANLIGKDVSELSPSVIAKVGYGVDLPKAEDIDFNKEFTPSGGLTPKGIGGKISKPFERASTIKTYKDKIDGAIALFKTQQNTQALLSAMITFQKALDEGAIVREGDIELQRSAQSLGDRLTLVIDQANKGQVVSETLVDQMQATMADFTQKALANEKVFIDPYLNYADKQGYDRITTVPKEAYDKVFNGVNVNYATSNDQQTGKPVIRLGVDGSMKATEDNATPETEISKMSASQLSKLDIDKMSDEEKQMVSSRLDELGL